MGAAHPDLVDLEDFALSYPEAFPTRYGLVKHGWWVPLFVDHVPMKSVMCCSTSSRRAIARLRPGW
jgi:hypothetical protein